MKFAQAGEARQLRSTVSMKMYEEVKRWTAKCKSALVLEIIQGKMTVSEASRANDLAPSEIEAWVDEGKRGMENALRANPLDSKRKAEANSPAIAAGRMADSLSGLSAVSGCHLWWCGFLDAADPVAHVVRIYYL
jgi:transposase-like protein